jgi:hypothetical protein
LYRWLGVHGRIEFHPRSVYYDPVTPFSGRERSLWLSATFQPNDKVRQEVSFGWYDSSRKRILADFLGAWEFVPGTVAYVGYGELYDRRGWDGHDWLPGQGSYLSTRRGQFLKLSYLYRF